MKFLGRFRILTKILAIVLLLSGITATIAWMGISALSDLSGKADVMSIASQRALMAARANQDVLALNRAEFRSALDPTDENRLAAREVIQTQLKQFDERFGGAAETVDDKAKAMIPQVRQAFAAYKQQLDRTLAVVDAEKSSSITDSARKLREAAMHSRAAAEDLQTKLRAFADRLDARVEEKAAEAHAEYVSISRLLTIIAIVGVVFGAISGFAVGHFGIVGPIRSIVALLQQLAAGRFEVDIHSADRKDEVGDVARTAQVFKENGIAKLRMEAEQKEAEQRVAQQRKQDMLQLADSFEAAVGEIIQTVSAASTELEASADTLTSTASRSQELATAVATASEEASTNVQSVASATEERRP
ncbi:HAMP domain-containing protein, partial [Rhodopseudomonas sp. B29]|uniref:HAMP domain-containing protein n=1 Tax=Rhodopseudomonas sp. B29 TaxID=95607 RepID=UPI0003B5929B